jgi:hypothetical protein
VAVNPNLPPEKLGRWFPDVISIRAAKIQDAKIDDIPSLASLREVIRKIAAMVYQLEGRNGPVTILNDVTILGDLIINNTTLEEFITNIIINNPPVGTDTLVIGILPQTEAYIQPVAEAEWTNGAVTPRRVQLDLSNFTEFRVSANVDTPIVNGLKIYPKYDSGGGDTRLGTSSGDLTVVAAAGVQTGAWEPIASGALADVELSIYTIAGDGVTFDSLISLHYHFR